MQYSTIKLSETATVTVILESDIEILLVIQDGNKRQEKTIPARHRDGSRVYSDSKLLPALRLAAENIKTVQDIQELIKRGSIII